MDLPLSIEKVELLNVFILPRDEEKFIIIISKYDCMREQNLNVVWRKIIIFILDNQKLNF